jgi:hypothetical protein
MATGMILVLGGVALSQRRQASASAAPSTKDRSQVST